MYQRKVHFPSLKMDPGNEFCTNLSVENINDTVKVVETHSAENTIKVIETYRAETVSQTYREQIAALEVGNEVEVETFVSKKGMQSLEVPTFSAESLESQVRKCEDFEVEAELLAEDLKSGEVVQSDFLEHDYCSNPSQTKKLITSISGNSDNVRDLLAAKVDSEEIMEVDPLSTMFDKETAEPSTTDGAVTTPQEQNSDGSPKALVLDASKLIKRKAVVKIPILDMSKFGFKSSNDSTDEMQGEDIPDGADSSLPTEQTSEPVVKVIELRASGSTSKDKNESIEVKASNESKKKVIKVGGAGSTVSAILKKAGADVTLDVEEEDETEVDIEALACCDEEHEEEPALELECVSDDESNDDGAEFFADPLNLLDHATSLTDDTAEDDLYCTEDLDSATASATASASDAATASDVAKPSDTASATVSPETNLKKPGKVQIVRGRAKKHCCILGCGNNDRNAKSVTFYAFPRHDPKQMASWVTTIGRIQRTPGRDLGHKKGPGSDWAPARDSYVCSAHFPLGFPSSCPKAMNYAPTILPSRQFIKKIVNSAKARKELTKSIELENQKLQQLKKLEVDIKYGRINLSETALKNAQKKVKGLHAQELKVKRMKKFLKEMKEVKSGMESKGPTFITRQSHYWIKVEGDSTSNGAKALLAALYSDEATKDMTIFSAGGSQVKCHSAVFASVSAFAKRLIDQVQGCSEDVQISLPFVKPEVLEYFIKRVYCVITVGNPLEDMASIKVLLEALKIDNVTEVKWHTWMSFAPPLKRVTRRKQMYPGGLIDKNAVVIYRGDDVFDANQDEEFVRNMTDECAVKNIQSVSTQTYISTAVSAEFKISASSKAKNHPAKKTTVNNPPKNPQPRQVQVPKSTQSQDVQIDVGMEEVVPVKKVRKNAKTIKEDCEDNVVVDEDPSQNKTIEHFPSECNLFAELTDGPDPSESVRSGGGGETFKANAKRKEVDDPRGSSNFPPPKRKRPDDQLKPSHIITPDGPRPNAGSHEKMIFNCTKCQAEIVTTWKNHTEIVTMLRKAEPNKNVNVQYQCKPCNMSATRKVLSNEGKDLKLCTDCGQRYKMPGHKCASTKHCHECGMECKSSDELESHLNVHFGLLPYVCSECGFKSHSKHGLTTHKQLCRNYVCGECGFKYHTKHGLACHKPMCRKTLPPSEREKRDFLDKLVADTINII